MNVFQAVGLWGVLVIADDCHGQPRGSMLSLVYGYLVLYSEFDTGPPVWCRAGDVKRCSVSSTLPGGQPQQYKIPTPDFVGSLFGGDVASMGHEAVFWQTMPARNAILRGASKFQMTCQLSKQVAVQVSRGLRPKEGKQSGLKAPEL